jgi:hypothetical protein
MAQMRKSAASESKRGQSNKGGKAIRGGVRSGQGRVSGVGSDSGPKGAPKMTVKVSPNVTVISPKTGRGTISGPEQARLKAINKPVKSTKKDVKKSAKALKASGTTPKNSKTTKYTKYDELGKRTVTARELAREAVAKRNAGGGGLRGGFGMGGGGGSGRSNVNR